MLRFHVIILYVLLTSLCFGQDTVSVINHKYLKYSNGSIDFLNSSDSKAYIFSTNGKDSISNFLLDTNFSVKNQFSEFRDFVDQNFYNNPNFFDYLQKHPTVIHNKLFSQVGLINKAESSVFVSVIKSQDNKVYYFSSM